MPRQTYSAKVDLRRAVEALEGADDLLHQIVRRLDLEWGPDSSSGLAVDIASIARHVTEALREARDLLGKSRGKLAIRRAEAP